MKFFILKINFLYFFLYFCKNISFYEEIEDDFDNYELICNSKYCKDINIHNIYKKLGFILSDKIWLSFDILASLKKDMSEDLVYYEILKDIVIQYEDLLKINKDEKLNHIFDTNRILNICNNILFHEFIINKKEFQIAIKTLIYIIEN